MIKRPAFGQVFLCVERLGDGTKSWIEIKIYGAFPRERVLIEQHIFAADNKTVFHIEATNN